MNVHPVLLTHKGKHVNQHLVIWGVDAFLRNLFDPWALFAFGMWIVLGHVVGMSDWTAFLAALGIMLFCSLAWAVFRGFYQGWQEANLREFNAQMKATIEWWEKDE